MRKMSGPGGQKSRRKGRGKRMLWSESTGSSESRRSESQC